MLHHLYADQRLQGLLTGMNNSTPPIYEAGYRLFVAFLAAKYAFIRFDTAAF